MRWEILTGNSDIQMVRVLYLNFFLMRKKGGENGSGKNCPLRHLLHFHKGTHFVIVLNRHFWLNDGNVLVLAINVMLVGFLGYLTIQVVLHLIFVTQKSNFKYFPHNCSQNNGLILNDPRKSYSMMCAISHGSRISNSMMCAISHGSRISNSMMCAISYDALWYQTVWCVWYRKALR